MERHGSFRLLNLLHCSLAALVLDLQPSQAQVSMAELCVGDTVALAGHRTTLNSVVDLPYVQSDYTKRFKFDAFENPKLQQLRQGYHLDDVVSAGRDEFDQQVRLMDWTHRQFKKFGTPTAQSVGALEILEDIAQGHTFYCGHYAKVLVSAAASLGWVDRELALRRHQGVAQGGSSEHSTTEIWSNQFRKWIMLDPTSNLYLEKNGIPLNAFEIRQEWFYHDGQDLELVVGKERNRYRKADLPVLLAHFAGFGDLAINPDELDKYGFIGYIPNTNLMDAREDYAQMFIVKDQLCAGTRWHERVLPANPARDPYFPIDQAAFTFRPAPGGIRVELNTFTPNFRQYEVRFDDGRSWEPQGPSFVWKLHAGKNRIEVVAVSRFNVRGSSSSAEFEMEP